MFDLPYDTHRHLIEPITDTRHVRIILLKRFMNFIQQIRKSTKMLPKLMLDLIKCDVKSTTGSNLRNILLQTRKVNVDQLDFRDIQQLQYYPTKDDEKWKENLVLEILNARNNNLEVDGFTDSELDEILQHLCSD